MLNLLEDVNLEEQDNSVEKKETELQALVDSWEERVKDATIEDADQYQDAAVYLKEIKKVIKKVQDHFEPERKRTYQIYQAVQKKMKGMVSILEKGEKAVKKAMADYQSELDRKRLEAEAAEREQARLFESDPVSAPALTTPIVPKEDAPPEGITYVDHYTFIVDDKSKVPAEYLMVDEKKVGKVVQSLKDDCKIPGISVIKEKRVRARV